MVEIKDQCGKVEVFKSYLKYIIFYKIYTLFFIALFSIITLKTINIFFNLLSVILIIGYIYISLFYISAEKIVIREDYLIIQALGNKEKVLYSKKIFLDEIKKIYFKDTFGISLMLDPGILNYLFNSKQKFMKIETDRKTYSFGLFLEHSDFLKINTILLLKLKEYADKKIMLNRVRKKQKELSIIYNLEIEERYKKILNIILDEKKLILLKKDDCYIINIGTEIESDLEIFKDMNFEEIDFYVFYVNYLSKKEYENKKVLVGYNGIDGKEVTMSKLKEDINEVRDSRSTLKKS
ncbi:hypothetical protein [Fusobacterium pseudoperiodonticum]|uniref:hypothetical protein n=1 Tax=Fusobacterium pseudoperiodonticum TaxID=2663009 RepID=UPI0028E6EE5E|nr:hypothetical protein [Fusobacterium pseudoperiodonticum]